MNSLGVILNDISIVPLPTSKLAREKATRLAEILRELSKVGFLGALHTENPYIGVFKLSEDYLFAHWFQDKTVEADLRNLFLSRAVNSPYLEGFPVEKDRANGCDFMCEQGRCDGLGAAFLLELPFLSFESSDFWCEAFVKVEITGYLENDEWSFSEVDVRNFSKFSHIETHKKWLKSKIARPEIRKGVDIWTHRQLLYPNLEFCDEVEKQLGKILDWIKVKQIQTRLQALQDYEGEHNSQELKSLLPECSGESDSTMNNSKLAQMREFTRPNREVVCCEWHMKIQGFNLRIHFNWEEETDGFIIGYIGIHLPT